MDRWLMKRGRHDEAMVVLSSFNKRSTNLSEEERDINTMQELKELKESTTVSSDQTYGDLFKEILQYKYRYDLLYYKQQRAIGGV